MPDKLISCKKSGKSFFKKTFSKLLVGAVNKINFVKLADRIAHSEAGRPFLSRFTSMPEDWNNVDDVRSLAVDLTMEQLKKDGEHPDRSEIEGLIGEIAMRYDRKIHENAACAIGVIFDQLFEHQNGNLPFTSPDGRDLKHLQQLKEYREQGLGVVYLINHSSHLDEFLVDLLWQNLHMGLPVFAAGQNMMAVKSIEDLLMIGSYVVLRQGASRYQMAALYNYCSAISRSGSQQGIFLEAWRGGARTRDGSLRYPKRLVTLKGAIDVDKDVVIQPVALSYSAVPEDLMMCSRKSARSWVRGMGLFRTLAKVPFSPKKFLWNSAENLYGRAYITTPPPMLLSDLKKAHQDDKSGITIDEFVALSSIKEIARNKKIMASQITARGLAQARKNGSRDINAAVASEMESVREYHKNTFGEEPDFEDYIRNHSVEEVAADGMKTLKRRGVVAWFRKDHKGLPLVKDEIALSYYATHADRRLYSPTANQNIVVVGAGNWGFALASLIGNRILEDKKYNNASLTIFDSRPDVAKHMGLNRQGPGRFSDKVLPKNVFVTCDHPSAFRKASEIIIASKPEDFEAHVRDILDVSEQPLKIMLATRGFIPGMNALPYHALRILLGEYGRTDVDILTIAGPVDPDDLVDSKSINGILAGPAGVLHTISDMFSWSPVKSLLSTDPIGVQTADILARVYAVWVNYKVSSKETDQASDIGHLMATASREARELALALGASPDTFHAGSIPWNATFISVCMNGPWREFGKQLGTAVKKGKEPQAVMKKLNKQWIKDGSKLQALTDIREAIACAAERNIALPVLQEAELTFWGEETKESIKN